MPLFSPLAPTTFVVETTTTLPTFPTTNNSNNKNATTRAAALALLHNHAAMIELNPLVESYALCDPDDDDIAAPPAPTARKGGHGDDAEEEEEEEASATYRITDTLPLLPGGLWSSRTTYAARFVDRADGLETAVRAALGVESRSVWVVVPSSAAEGPEESKLLLRETATVTCPWAVKPFVEGTIRKAHKELMHAFVERLERGEAAEPVGKKEKKKKTGAK